METKKFIKLREELSEKLEPATLKSKRADWDFYINSTDENINADNNKRSAINDGENLVENLQTALQENLSLRDQIVSLQEKLSVCYAKELTVKEEMDGYKNNLSKLTESVKRINPLKERVNNLTEQLNVAQSKFKKLESLNSQYKNNLSMQKQKVSQLEESLKDKSQLVSQLTDQVKSINSSYKKETNRLNESINTLSETVEDLKKDSAIKQKEYSAKLESYTGTLEKYRKIAKKAVNKYMEQSAGMLGISVQDIKNKLKENYSFNDIDSVCEDLKIYKLNMDNLPFNTKISSNKSKIKMTEQLDPLVKQVTNIDDSVDSSLMELAGLD